MFFLLHQATWQISCAHIKTLIIKDLQTSLYFKLSYAQKSANLLFNVFFKAKLQPWSLNTCVWHVYEKMLSMLSNKTHSTHVSLFFGWLFQVGLVTQETIQLCRPKWLWIIAQKRKSYFRTFQSNHVITAQVKSAIVTQYLITIA